MCMRQDGVMCMRQGGVMCMRPTSSLNTQSSLCSWMSGLAVLRAPWRLHALRLEERLETLRLPSKTCRLHTESFVLTNAHEVQDSGKRCVHASMEKAIVWGTRIVAKTVAKAHVVEKEPLVYGEGGSCACRRRRVCVEKEAGGSCVLCLVTSVEKEALVCRTPLHMHSKTHTQATQNLA